MTPLRDAVGPTGQVVGVDFCLPMLEIARRKSEAARLSLGDACQLPVASGAFQAVSVGWGIRNVPDIDGAHAEAFRVLAPGGRFVSLDMAIPRATWMRRLSNAVFFRLAPALGRVFGHTEAYRYLPESTQRFLGRDELVASMERAGFVGCGYRDLFFGNVCMHWGRRP
jgi:demethylmenaquinone methyltransferase/2-methoxy-6-polyprenyl-1,4-benzoquinol methylase